MQNAEMTLEGSQLLIRVDLDQEHGRSKSGKTINIASTRGASTAPPPFDHVKVNLNIYKYPSR
jgi:hypothetical protein